MIYNNNNIEKRKEIEKSLTVVYSNVHFEVDGESTICNLSLFYCDEFQLDLFEKRLIGGYPLRLNFLIVF